MKIGIISDTHGLLRTEVLKQLKDCDAIIHGGDINRQDILDQLENIAELYVVRGNNDKEWAEHLPLFLSIEFDGVRIFITHKKKDVPEDFSGFDLVVNGHTHRYEEKKINDTVFLNPGCCGPRKETQPITMAVLSVDNGKFSISKIDIKHH